MVCRRKIIRVGDSSVAVVLPKPWVDYCGLLPGDRVVLTCNGDLLIQLKKEGKGA
ncbi:MAG: AbrB/MazE/SpoVT family DNA-binding domain-containing protein [Thermoplasmatota archaeon]